MSNQDLIVTISLWIFWCALHSGMISISVTTFLKKKLGNAFRYYRMFYNIVAVITLIPLYLFSLSRKGELVYSWDGGMRIIQLLLFGGSLVIFYLGARKYDLNSFLGLEQIKSGANHAVMSESGKLDTSGILGFTRHPWYLGGLMLIWSSQQHIHATRFWIDVVLTGYFLIGTLLEERKLKRELGQSYLDYCQQVSMLLPFKWLRAKLFKRQVSQ